MCVCVGVCLVAFICLSCIFYYVSAVLANKTYLLSSIQAELELAMKPVRRVGSRIRTQWTAVSLVHNSRNEEQLQCY